MSAAERFFLIADDQSFDWLHSDSLRALFALLNEDGEEVRVVGGAVRNSLVGVPIGDIDCATTGEPSWVVEKAQAAGLKVLPTGIDHGTVTIVIDGDPFEVTSLRADVETDGRHATVAFGKSWTDDAHRRDFTMNALYLDADGRLYDPTGLGIDDARNRHVRFIGDAQKRIEEDYLRILRFFRFFAQYGHDYGAQDYRACIKLQEGLAQLSAERIGVEMGKLVKGAYADKALEAMLNAGILSSLLHGVPRLSRFIRLHEICSSLRYEPGLPLRLACLAVNVPEDAHRLASSWRLPNRERDAMIDLTQHSRRIKGWSEADLQKLAYRFGKDLTCDMIVYAIVKRRIDPDLTGLSMDFRSLDLWTPPRFPLNGRDLMERGMKAGPHLGKRLCVLEERWIESHFSLSKSALLARPWPQQ